jgi:hypothetical protein
MGAEFTSAAALEKVQFLELFSRFWRLKPPAGIEKHRALESNRKRIA